MISSVKILLIEDDFSFQAAIQRFLGVYNDIRVVSNLTDARATLTQFPNYYKVILLDKSLPDGSGIEFLEEFRNKIPDTVIIVLTGDCDFNSANKCMNLGADDYVIKSENIVQDLLIKIPFALRNISIREEFKKTQLAPKLILPSSEFDLTKNHYQNFILNAEKEYLTVALNLCQGEVSKTAHKIGLSRSTIFKKMTLLGIEKRLWIKKETT